MDRRSLGFVALILIVLMGIVATAGLDDLPRTLRESAAAAHQQLDSDRAAFQQKQRFVEQALNDEPVLFQSQSAGWRDRIAKDSSRLGAAALSLAALDQLVKANRRADSEKVQRALADFETARQEPLRDVSNIQADANRWLTYKRELPQRLASMRAAYDSLKAFDIAAATAPVQKAMIDWPAKKDDLQGRLDGLKVLQTQGEQVWDSTAPARAAAEAKNEAGLDYTALFSASDRLDAASRQLKQSADSLNALAGQLYTARDKILVDVDDGDGYREKIRAITTTFPDATLTNGQTKSEERWETIDESRAREDARRAGMTVEHKPAGKYNSEGERTVQPPAYAYVAPPGQANAYGSWQNGVWQWLPQYLLLSHLLNASRGPVTTGDFEAYQRARSRGEVFYGRNDEYRPRWRHTWGGPGSSTSGGLRGALERGWGGSGGERASRQTEGWHKERPKPSWGDRAFGGSKYESRGTFGGSRFQSRGGFGSGRSMFGSRPYSRSFGSFGRSFGRGGRR